MKQITALGGTIDKNAGKGSHYMAILKNKVKVTLPSGKKYGAGLAKSIASSVVKGICRSNGTPF